MQVADLGRIELAFDNEAGDAQLDNGAVAKGGDGDLSDAGGSEGNLSMDSGMLDADAPVANFQAVFQGHNAANDNKLSARHVPFQS